MTTLYSSNYPSDWLKSESGTGEYFSRDQGVLASGQGKLVTGTVLAQLTANGKWVVAASGTTDGSQIAAGILFDRSVDATSADQPVVIVTRHAVVGHAGLVWGPSINSPTLRAAAVAQLKSKGIIDRQAA